MRKLLFTISLVLFSFPLIAQELNPNYFHDLSGFEDSTGKTHLFYRFSKTDTVYVSSWFRENHVRHLDTSTQLDSIIFFSTEKDWGLPGFTESITIDYDFYSNTPTNWIQIETPFQRAPPIITDYRSKSIEFPFPYLLKGLGSDYYTPPSSLILNPSADSIYAIIGDFKTIPLSADTVYWPNFGINEQTMIEYFDSTHFDYHLLEIHPEIDSLYFGIDKNGHLYKSNRYSSSFQVSDSSAGYSHYRTNIFFDANTKYIYTQESDILRVSNQQGDKDSWSVINLPSEFRKLEYVVTDPSVFGSLFIADSNLVYRSFNYGSSFEQFLDFNSQITGLYKKPNSDILYVLTRTDLYKVENGQPTSIKQVPVSNEENPDIPASVLLKQNYPNPFNPTTTIEFELNQATFTKLTVYDVLGREVQELVNEIRPAGTNTIQFDATSLASGIYLYRLEASNTVQTKRLTLIK